MYQRIITFTRMFRERWTTPQTVSSLSDGTFTADAAVYPTSGGVLGRGAICFLSSVWRGVRACDPVRLRPVRTYLACGAW